MQANYFHLQSYDNYGHIGSVMDIVAADLPSAGASSTHQRITNYLKHRITSEELSPGHRLPPIADLASMLGVSVFTVHTALTPLVKSGLLIRKRRSGTFVAERKTKIENAAIYYSHNFWGGKEMDFYRVVHQELVQQLEAQGIRFQVFIDSRSLEEEDNVVMPELSKAVAQGDVQCVICPLVAGDTSAARVQKLPVPSVFLAGGRGIGHRVTWEFASFLKLGLDSLKHRGARNVAVISTAPSTTAWPFAKVAELARSRELNIQSNWFRAPQGRIEPSKCEAYGHEQFLSIWSGAERPDGLIVYSDVVVRGVILGLAGQQVDVPCELKLAFHKNEGVDIYCPFPVTWITSRVSDLVRTMIEGVHAQFRGGVFEPTTLPFYASSDIPAN